MFLSIASTNTSESKATQIVLGVVASPIAFRSNRTENNEIYLMNGDGSSQTSLSRNASEDCSSSWSPDGTKIAFGSERDSNNEIYIMNADGSGQARLTDNPAFDALPTGHQMVSRSSLFLTATVKWTSML